MTKKWFTERCNGCKSFSDECRYGCCCLYDNTMKHSDVKREENNAS